MVLTKKVLESNRIGERDVFYVPNFLSTQEEEYILRKIMESPQQKWKQLANRRLQTWGGEITRKGLLPQNLPPFLAAYPNVVKRLQETGVFSDSPHGCPNHIILNEYLSGQGIMPHEDGPRYFPLVATISLGSFAVFNYYRYRKGSSENGKLIENDTMLSILLEPRSLIISTGEMYTSHLHGIDAVKEDHIHLPHAFGALGNAEVGLDHSRDVDVPGAMVINNWHLLEDETVNMITANDGVVKRGTRYSLTCRDVEHVSIVKSLFKMK